MTLSIVRSTCRVWSSVRETSPLIIYLFLVRMKMCRVESTSLNSTSTLSRQNPSQDDVREGRKSSPSIDRETFRFVLLCAKTSFRVDFTLHEVMVQLTCSLFTGTRRINGIAAYVTQEGRQTHKVAWGSLRSILTTARRLLQSIHRTISPVHPIRTSRQHICRYATSKRSSPAPRIFHWD